MKTGFWIERITKVGGRQGGKGSSNTPVTKTIQIAIESYDADGKWAFCRIRMDAILYFRAIYHPDCIKKRYFSSTGATLKDRLLLKRLFPLFFRIIFHFSVFSLQLFISVNMETYFGHIKTPQDALVIFEACRLGQLRRIQRRLSAKEGLQIKSGAVFAWDESEAGMRRWTDGRTWSPSRVSGSFLTYRELATKRRPRRTSKTTPIYTYKTNGLIKQSFSICTAANQKLHLISYYNKADVVAGRLTQPTADCTLSNIVVPRGVYPDLNPLDTGGGHSATVRNIRRPSSVPSLTLSPVSSDEEPTGGELGSPVFYYTPRSTAPPPLLSTPAPILPPLLLIQQHHPDPLVDSNNDTRCTEDKRQLNALERQLQL